MGLNVPVLVGILMALSMLVAVAVMAYDSLRQARVEEEHAGESRRVPRDV